MKDIGYYEGVILVQLFELIRELAINSSKLEWKRRRRMSKPILLTTALRRFGGRKTIFYCPERLFIPVKPEIIRALAGQRFIIFAVAYEVVVGRPRVFAFALPIEPPIVNIASVLERVPGKKGGWQVADPSVGNWMISWRWNHLSYWLEWLARAYDLSLHSIIVAR